MAALGTSQSIGSSPVAFNMVLMTLCEQSGIVSSEGKTTDMEKGPYHITDGTTDFGGMTVPLAPPTGTPGPAAQ